MQGRVGSLLAPGSQELIPPSTWGRMSCSFEHDLGHFRLACRGNASSVDNLLSGSSLGRTSTSTGYGPCRRALTTLKVLGGAVTCAEQPVRQTAEAQRSPTTEQLSRETVSFGTLAVQSLANLLNMEVDDDTSLNFEERTLFELCSKDLLSSCQGFLLSKEANSFSWT